MPPPVARFAESRSTVRCCAPFGACLAVVLCVLTVPAVNALDDPNDYDADRAALDRLRKRIVEKPLTSRLGVILYTSAQDWSYARLTVPIWRAYCEKHGFDFWLQDEPLVAGIRHDWSKPRLITELAELTKWKYALYVEPDTLPVGYNKSWEYAITEHMRHRRWKQDKPSERVVFCPWDCESDYKDQLAEGACYGPMMSGCIWHFKKKASDIAYGWYDKRKSKKGDPSSSTAVRKALDKTKEGVNWEAMYWKDVQKEIGKSDSRFIATFGFAADAQNSIAVQVEQILTKNPTLGSIVNRAMKPGVSTEL